MKVTTTSHYFLREMLQTMNYLNGMLSVVLSAVAYKLLMTVL